MEHTIPCQIQHLFGVYRFVIFLQMQYVNALNVIYSQ